MSERYIKVANAIQGVVQALYPDHEGKFTMVLDVDESLIPDGTIVMVVPVGDVIEPDWDAAWRKAKKIEANQYRHLSNPRADFERILQAALGEDTDE